MHSLYCHRMHLLTICKWFHRDKKPNKFHLIRICGSLLRFLFFRLLSNKLSNELNYIRRHHRQALIVIEVIQS